MRISDWSSDVCSSDLSAPERGFEDEGEEIGGERDADHDQPADRLDEADHRAARGGEREEGQPLMRLDVAAGAVRIAADDRQRDARDRRQGEGERHPQPMIGIIRSEEHTSALQSLMPNSY